MRRSKTGRSKWLQRDWESEIKAFFKGYWSEKKKKEQKKESLYKPYEQMSEQDKNI